MRTLRTRNDPEAQIREALRTYLSAKGWYCMITHGNMFQAGFPDVYATHFKFGPRWIEVKLPDMKGSKFTPAQIEHFPKLEANGSKIWILTGANDVEYAKLFKPSNFQEMFALSSLRIGH